MSNSNGSDYWQVSLGFSIPIGPTSNPSYLYNSVVKTTEGETYSSSYSNSIDKYSTYGLSVSYDATNDDTTTSANINRKFNKISSYASVSHSENNTNWSASLSGSLLKIAESPIAMSSEHYNSALLVDIGNEQEVRFTHGHNSSDDRGLLIGSLSTYTSNDKVISSSSLGIGIELQDNYYRIKPTQDALFYQVNEVTQRIPILMIFDNQDLPLGSEIRQGDNVVGTVGFDNSQLVNFIIGESERLTVFDNGNLICHVDNIGILDEKIKLKKVPVKYVQCK